MKMKIEQLQIIEIDISEKDEETLEYYLKQLSVATIGVDIIYCYGDDGNVDYYRDVTKTSKVTKVVNRTITEHEKAYRYLVESLLANKRTFTSNNIYSDTEIRTDSFSDVKLLSEILYKISANHLFDYSDNLELIGHAESVVNTIEYASARSAFRKYIRVLKSVYELYSDAFRGYHEELINISGHSIVDVTNKLPLRLSNAKGELGSVLDECDSKISNELLLITKILQKIAKDYETDLNDSVFPMFSLWLINVFQFQAVDLIRHNNYGLSTVYLARMAEILLGAICLSSGVLKHTGNGRLGYYDFGKKKMVNISGVGGYLVKLRDNGLIDDNIKRNLMTLIEARNNLVYTHGFSRPIKDDFESFVNQAVSWFHSLIKVHSNWSYYKELNEILNMFQCKNLQRIVLDRYIDTGL